MNKFKIFFTASVFIIVLPFAALKAQTASKSSLFNTSSIVSKPTGFLDKLLSSSKFHMSHSYSMEFFSMGSQSAGLGLYTNKISLQLAAPLSAQVKIGYAHPISGLGMNSFAPGGNLFLQQATIKYQPIENMQIRVDYRSYPAGYFMPFYGMR
ncbi:hypothetical protein J7K93_09770 [bacterium]|nr:hypothetical protein [bacterium]